MMYVKYPLSLRNVEDLVRARDRHQPRDSPVLVEQVCPIFAAEIRKKRVAHMRVYPQWRWRWMRCS